MKKIPVKNILLNKGVLNVVILNQIISSNFSNGLGMKDSNVPGNFESSVVFSKKKACILLTSSFLTSAGTLYQWAKSFDVSY